jgi:hypothetical protein
MAAAQSGGERSMKVYEVECRAVIKLAAEDMLKAALYGAEVIKDNPHLIYVRAVHERNFEPMEEDPKPQSRANHRDRFNLLSHSF